MTPWYTFAQPTKSDRSECRTHSRRTFLRHASVFAAIASLPMLACSQSGSYRCPPCGCAMDGRIFSGPGRCPACGMMLVPDTAELTSTARDGKTLSAERGFFDVPEDRRSLSSRTIRIHYLRVRSTAAKPGFPVVYLAGGPGASGIAEVRGALSPTFAALAEVGDVILLDQRGTGASNAIPPCPMPPAVEVRLTREALTELYRNELQRCWTWWHENGVAIDGYNTVQSAADVDQLRRHLNVEQLNLFGISYGTHLAQAVIKYHGSGVHRAILASNEGLHQTVKRPAAVDAVIKQVDDLLQADSATRAAYPDLPGLMRNVHAKLDRQPIRVKIPVAGKTTEVVVSGFALQMIAGQFIKTPAQLGMLPLFYTQLDRGDHTGLVQIYSRVGASYPPVRGMPEAMDLASGISRQRAKEIASEARDSIVGDALNFPVPQLQGVLPKIDLGDEFRTPMRTSVPALLIAGTLDGRTPLTEQREVGAQFKQATWIVVENAGHDVVQSTPGVPEYMTRFLRGESFDSVRLQLPEPKFLLSDD